MSQPSSSAAAAMPLSGDTSAGGKTEGEAKKCKCQESSDGKCICVQNGADSCKCEECVAGNANLTSEDTLIIDPEDKTRIQELERSVPAEERGHLVHASTREEIAAVPDKAPEAEHRRFLVAIDPKSPDDMNDRILRLTARMTQPGDEVIVLAVLNPIVLNDTGFGLYTVPQTAYERKAYLSRLRQIRTRHAHELSIKSEEILKNVKIYVHVVHGIPEQKLLWAAERHNCDLIIIGKRTLGRFERLFAHSVSNFLTSRATIPVIVAK